MMIRIRLFYNYTDKPLEGRLIDRYTGLHIDCQQPTTLWEIIPRLFCYEYVAVEFFCLMKMNLLISLLHKYCFIVI